MGVLHLPSSVRDAVVAYARADHPDECCGVMAGTWAGSDVTVSRAVAMTNAEPSPTWFSFDSAEQLKVWREIDDADEEVVVIYHSHTMTEPAPSRTDLQFAEGTGEALWLLVSTRSDDDEVKAWRIVGGAAVEEEIVLVGG